MSTVSPGSPYAPSRSGASAFEPAPTMAPPGAMPMMGAAPVQKNSGLAVTSMVMGIIGAALGWIPMFGWFFLAPICGLLGVIFGGISVKTTGNQPNQNKGKGMAIAGLVLGFLSLGWFVMGIIIASFFFDEMGFFAIAGTL